MSDTFDKSSTLKIDGEVLNRSSFKKTLGEKLARRVSNEADDPLSVVLIPSTSDTSVNEYSEISSLASGSLTTILSYTVPVGKTLFLNHIEVSGGNIAKYQVEINSIVKGTRRTYWGNFNSDFYYNKQKILSGIIIKVSVIHTRPIVADFNATLLGTLI